MNRVTKNIDWSLIRSRLAQSQAALNNVFATDTAKVESVLEWRAIQLAARRAEVSAASACVPVQAFLLGERRFSIELSQIVEIIAFGSCTPVPGAPPEFLGVINLRGEIRAVIDLPRFLDLSDHLATAGYVLLVGKRGQEVGLRVDRLQQITLISRADLIVAGNPSIRFIKAFARDKLNLLDVDAILSHVALATRNHTKEDSFK